MKFLYKFLLAILLVFNFLSFSAQDTLYSFGADNSYIELLDSTNFDTLGYIPLSSDIGLVDGVNGVDSDPCGQIYIIFKTDQTDDRNLGIVDLFSGVITNRGVLSDKIANITISSDGTIYGVTGDGADNPEILYTINPRTAVLTYLDSLGNGDDGESIEYCPDNNKIYHWSGWGSGDVIMESIDLLTLVKDSIVLTGVGSNLIQNVGASTYAGNGEFICFDVNEELYFRIDTLGYVSDSIEPIGNDYVKGLVFQEGNFNVPNVNITPNDSILTCNESILISGASGGSLQWFYNNRAIIGANSNSIYASRHGEYNQSKTNLNGCTNFGRPIHIIDTCPRTAYAFPAWEIGNDTTSVLEAVNSQTLDSLYTIGLSSILGNVIGVNGADTDPCGIPFLVYKIDNDEDTNGYQIRRLGVLDLTNGAILDRGPLSDKIANLTFSSNGTLYGVTGDGADNPEILYTINPTTAVLTYLDSLGNGDDGESIEYCPDDNNIYHWSGWGSGDVIMEKINLTTFSVQSINLHGLGVDEIGNVGSSTYSGYGEFLCFDVNEELYFRIDTSGYVSSPIFPLGIDEGIKGLFFLEGQNFNDAVEVNVSICNGDSALINGNYQTSAGSYSDTLSNSLGCDSVVNTVLAIYYSNTGTDTQTACDSLTWIDGVTYTSSNNTATHTLTNAAGCDSVVTLDLTINYSNIGTDTQTACDSLTWIDGVTYTASNNTATHTLTNASGCDSVVTLDLTIYEFLTDFSESSALFTGPPFVVQFTNNTPNLTNYNFSWDFGDSTIEQNNNASIFHEYMYNGLYDVTLILEDITNGCGFDTLKKEDLIYCAGGPNLSIIEFSNNINVFPNPTNENITISIENFNGNVQTEVYDLIGNRLQTTNETTISLRDYARGIYLLKVAYGDTVEEVKVIKQ